jgi:PAS domain S-box-containing protein
MLRMDGTRIVVEVHGRPVTSGNARRLTAVRDVTERERAEEALRDNVRLLNDILDGCSPSAIFLKDRDGRFITISAPLEKMLGLSRDELKGKTDYDLFPNEVADRYRAHDTQVMATAESIQVEEEADLPDGHHIFLANKFPLVDAAGHVYGVGAISHDITERKQAEAALHESEARYRTLFNTVDAGFCVIEVLFDGEGKPADYRFLEVNAAFEKQTGLHDAEGKRMRELAPAHEAHWFETYGKIALTGEPLHFVNEARQLNRWFDVYAYRIGQPESRQVAILFNDISEHKQAEAELRRRAEELRAANEELTRFNRVTVGRELRIIELKKQVNELHARLGQPPRYGAELDEAARP